MAGFLHSCAALPEAEIVPLLAADANPAGLVQAATYVALRDELLEHLARAQRTRPLDVVLLALHGAMVAEGEDDPEGAVLAAVRENRWAGGAYRGLARPARQRHRAHGRGGGRARRLPDLSPRGSAADRRTGGGAGAGRGAGVARGREPSCRKSRSSCRPRRCRRRTAPWHEVRAEADWLEAEGAALAVSVFGMQPWLDLPEAGCSIVVVGAEADDAHVHAPAASPAALATADGVRRAARCARRSRAAGVDGRARAGAPRRFGRQHLRRIAGRLRRRLAGAPRRRLRPNGRQYERHRPVSGAARGPAGGRSGPMPPGPARRSP